MLLSDLFLFIIVRMFAIQRTLVNDRVIDTHCTHFTHLGRRLNSQSCNTPKTRAMSKGPRKNQKAELGRVDGLIFARWINNIMHFLAQPPNTFTPEFKVQQSRPQEPEAMGVTQLCLMYQYPSPPGLCGTACYRGRLEPAASRYAYSLRIVRLSDGLDPVFLISRSISHGALARAQGCESLALIRGGRRQMKLAASPVINDEPFLAGGLCQAKPYRWVSGPMPSCGPDTRSQPPPCAMGSWIRLPGVAGP